MTISDSRIDWKKKGFGWIPDLPDVDDQNRILETNENDQVIRPRIVTQGSLSRLEDLAKHLIDLVKENQSSNDLSQNGLDKTINNQFYDNSFVGIKVYKVLKKGILSSEAEILQLKQAIYAVYIKNSGTSKNQEKLRKFRRELSEIEEVNRTFHDGPYPAKWLKDPSFDPLLDKIVKAFQHATKLKVDGIVGLKTCAAIERLLDEKEDEESEDDLFCPPSLNDKDILEEIYRHLVGLWVYSQINKRLRKFSEPPKLKLNISQILNELKEKIVDQDVNTIQSLSNYFEKLLKLNSSEEAAPAKDQKQDLLGEFVKSENFKSKFNPNSFKDFHDNFKRNFYIIEPLVSAFLQAMSPLASFDNPRQAVKTGLDRFDCCLQLDKLERQDFIISYKSLLIEASPAKLINQIEDLKSLNKSASNLLQETLSKIKRIREEGNSDEESFLRFLEEIIVDYYDVRDEDETQPPLADHGLGFVGNENVLDNKSSGSSFLLGKDDLFEILISNDNKSHTTSHPACSHEDNSLEQNLRLDVRKLCLPIDRNLYEKIVQSQDDTTKIYYFLPGAIDLSYQFSPVIDQGEVNACTAFAGVSLLEHFAQKRYRKYIRLSPRFLYKTARNLMNHFDDSGASVRQTMKAIMLFGVPPEEAWPWDEQNVDEEPPSFCYSYARNYQGLKCFRLDVKNIPSRKLLLFQIKAVLAAGFPCMFGFTVYNSFYKDKNIQRGYIPYPSNTDQVVGGHTAVAVGYNDHKHVDRMDSQPTKPGAILIRNSWGQAWGNEGYGWLPYDYILGGLTADWWSLLQADWFDGGAFGLGAVYPGKDIPPPHNRNRSS